MKKFSRVPSGVAALLLSLIGFLGLGFFGMKAWAQTSPSTLYVPIIGISSVPQPLSLPKGPGDVTYHYTVKNFLPEYPLSDVRVVDDKCSPVKFIEGDDNKDGKLDFAERWRYTCTARLTETTQSVATATGTFSNLRAAHRAYATVLVGSDTPAPLVNIINITKVAYPLTLPVGGGDITFTYRVNNPGIVPLSDVRVTDDKCPSISNKLGDTNANNLLDNTEVWTYTCTTHLSKTTTNTASVVAAANGLKAYGNATITVVVAIPGDDTATQNAPLFPETGTGPQAKNIVWAILSGVFAGLFVLSLLIERILSHKAKKGGGALTQPILIAILVGMIVAIGLYFILQRTPTVQSIDNTGKLAANTERFGWKFPIVKFPTLGVSEIAYSDIRDPGGIPQGLPMRLKIPSIGVDSAIEDALITPDGRMDVPSGSRNVAWFALGPHPGQTGSAVIGGHFGITNGVPFVFYDLDKLEVGDKIYVVNDRNETLGFVVRTISLFDRNADATTVFTSADGIAHLNLITCEGVWNRVNGTYPERRVVFTDALPPGEVVEGTAPIQRQLRLGSSGVDVTTLQAILVKKGFLVMPRGVVGGYYGTLTRSAVAQYQKSVGLAANGVFNATTGARLYKDSGLPSTGVTSTSTGRVTEENVTLWRRARTLFASIGAYFHPLISMYATPLEGLFTSILLFGITYVLLKITKRLSRSRK